MQIRKSTFLRLFPVMILWGVLPMAEAQFTQLGAKFTGTGFVGTALQGNAVAISADGSTVIVGGFFDNSFAGAAWVFTRVNGVWTQQGTKLVGTGAVGAALEGSAVAISADGNTAIIGGYQDNTGVGAAWIFTRASGIWTQQGPKLVGAGAVGMAGQGISVALSGDGNTAILGGNSDNRGSGAVWVFVRSAGTWNQQGDKLVGRGAVGTLVEQGDAVAVSADGNTLIEGGPGDNDIGAAWVFTRTGTTWAQQGDKLTASNAGGLAGVGQAVAISSDGNTAVVGGSFDSNSAGAAWVFTRTTNVWTQQGGKLVGTGAVDPANQGNAVAISGDGNTVLIGGLNDNNEVGAAWAFGRVGGVWSQKGSKLVGTGAVGAAGQARSVALSSDGLTAVVGGNLDNSGAGAVWAFTATPVVVTTPSAVGVSPNSGSGSSQTFAFTFADSGGGQSLSVVDVLIRNVLDAHQACYIAFAPSGATAGTVFLVNDTGNGGGPFAGSLVLPGSGTIQNSQCSITGAGSSAAVTGDALTLTLAISFTPAFAGNKVLYLSALDASANSDWQALGTWNIPGPPVIGPAVSGMTPGYSNSATVTYVFTFMDSIGWQDIGVVNVLVNSAINGAGACYLAYVPAGAASGAVYLVDDAGDAGGPYTGLVLPGSGTASNSQCTITGTGSSVTASGSTMTLTLAITFKHSFAGNKIFFLAARNNTVNSGWQSVGAVAVP